MSNPVKLTLYILLALIAAVSGFLAIGQWKSVMNRPPAESELERIEPEFSPSVVVTQEMAAAEAVTNLAASNDLAAVTPPTGATNRTGALDTAGITNPSVAEVPLAAELREENLEDVDVSVPTALGGRGNVEGKQSRAGLWSGIFLLSLVGLAILIGFDVAHFFGNKTLDVIYNDEGHGMGNPEYEAAEQTWANGEHLEAIRMMREYLHKNPREQFVALRIAEIYEKDLGNFLAAALEYEEVLKHKLKPDRWGWAAIHLCNLYFKLNQEGKAQALLRRIVKEYPETAAAEKARKRLEQMGEQEISEEIPTENQVISQPEQSRSNLPPGFRPKK